MAGLMDMFGLKKKKKDGEREDKKKDKKDKDDDAAGDPVTRQVLNRQEQTQLEALEEEEGSLVTKRGPRRGRY